MNNDENLLITLTNGQDIYKVALKFRYGLIPKEAIDYYRESEYENVLKNLLPLHCQSLGNIVEVEELFEIKSLI